MLSFIIDIAGIYEHQSIGHCRYFCCCSQFCRYCQYMCMDTHDLYYQKFISQKSIKIDCEHLQKFRTTKRNAKIDTHRKLEGVPVPGWIHTMNERKNERERHTHKKKLSKCDWQSGKKWASKRDKNNRWRKKNRKQKKYISITQCNKKNVLRFDIVFNVFCFSHSRILYYSMNVFVYTIYETRRNTENSCIHMPFSRITIPIFTSPHTLTQIYGILWI